VRLSSAPIPLSLSRAPLQATPRAFLPPPPHLSKMLCSFRGMSITASTPLIPRPNIFPPVSVDILFLSLKAHFLWFERPWFAAVEPCAAPLPTLLRRLSTIRFLFSSPLHSPSFHLSPPEARPFFNIQDRLFPFPPSIIGSLSFCLFRLLALSSLFPKVQTLEEGFRSELCARRSSKDLFPIFFSFLKAEWQRLAKIGTRIRVFLTASENI